MTAPQPTDISANFACHVYGVSDVFVSSGANLGDDISDAGEVCDGDVYQLDRTAKPQTLCLLQPKGAGGTRVNVQTIAEGSDIGAPGNVIHLTSRLTMMATDGAILDVLILRFDTGDTGPRRYVLPLAPLSAGTDYTLLRTEANPTDVRLSDIVCMSFAHGTMITMADGRQCGIEMLQAGDRVLTRDSGPQPVRWIGKATLRAAGNFTPVVITAGTLGNAGDLIVSQHHRLFIYKRNRSADLKTAEVLIQAKHLVDNEKVFLRPGGFVDYFSLVFDRHEIIYAEGIPAESLMVNDGILSRLPEEIAQAVKAKFPGLSQTQHFGTEAGRQFLDAIGPERLFNWRGGR